MSVKALLSRADGTDESVDIEKWPQRRISDDELLWVDLEGSDKEEAASSVQLSNCARTRRTPLKLTLVKPSAGVLEKAVEIVVFSPPDDRLDEPIGLRVLMRDGTVITRHAVPMPLLGDHRQRIQDQREVGTTLSPSRIARPGIWPLRASLSSSGPMSWPARWPATTWQRTRMYLPDPRPTPSPPRRGSRSTRQPIAPSP